MEKTWSSIIESESRKEYFVNLRKFILDEYCNGKTIYPNGKDIFNAFKYFPYEQTKVIIIGQDPYHGENEAHGLCFSVRKGVKVPPSLENIFKELKSDINFSHPKHGCLEKWATQGVLMLNSILTVEKDKAGSHQGIGWEILTDEIIKQVDKLNDVAFILWGKFAQSKKSLLSNKNNAILEASHPSPFSAYNGFFGCKHFSRTNSFLKGCGKTQIDWTL